METPIGDDDDSHLGDFIEDTSIESPVDAATGTGLHETVRDVLAGRAAGMATLAAAWGYLGQGEPIEQWGADHVLDEPAALLHWLQVP